MQTGFRYSCLKYSDSLLALGNIRIGTLHDFRRVEHRAGISDQNEGMKRVSHYIAYADDAVMHKKDFEAVRHMGVVNAATGVNLKFTDVTISRNFDTPDCFVHCISSVYSQKALEQFEGADSCVEITDILGFYRRLTLTLNTHVPTMLLAIAEVNYKPRQEIWNGKDWGVHPALIKELKFSEQREIRAIWQARPGQAIAPIVLNDHGLLPFLKRRSAPTKY
ncbi:hypothetical protein [Pseudomonas syringae]|uniref:hypothetical protein n=1 Tax=Pseudomonas syringae TaxID=317 RepID=UPI00112512B1|nr:hypothetical protein [Pseudomonas syringae]